MSTPDAPLPTFTLIDEACFGEPFAIPKVILDDLTDGILSEMTEHWQPATPEIVGGGPKGAIGLVLARSRRQIAYSVKLPNVMRSPAIIAMAAAASAGLAPATPVNFWIHLTVVAIAWMRCFGHSIPYGEAALLHLLNQIDEREGQVTHADLAGAGAKLVDDYGYVKGNKGNEVAAILASLVAWKAIEEIEGGYLVHESVPFGLGRCEYVPTLVPDPNLYDG